VEYSTVSAREKKKHMVDYETIKPVQVTLIREKDKTNSAIK
jgi:hypothetical protein